MSGQSPEWLAGGLKRFVRPTEVVDVVLVSDDVAATLGSAGFQQFENAVHVKPAGHHGSGSPRVGRHLADAGDGGRERRPEMGKAKEQPEDVQGQSRTEMMKSGQSGTLTESKKKQEIHHGGRAK